MILFYGILYLQTCDKRMSKADNDIFPHHPLLALSHFQFYAHLKTILFHKSYPSYNLLFLALIWSAWSWLFESSQHHIIVHLSLPLLIHQRFSFCGSPPRFDERTSVSKTYKRMDIHSHSILVNSLVSSYWWFSIGYMHASHEIMAFRRIKQCFRSTVYGRAAEADSSLRHSVQNADHLARSTFAFR